MRHFIRKYSGTSEQQPYWGACYLIFVEFGCPSEVIKYLHTCISICLLTAVESLTSLWETFVQRFYCTQNSGQNIGPIILYM